MNYVFNQFDTDIDLYDLYPTNILKAKKEFLHLNWLDQIL